MDPMDAKTMHESQRQRGAVVSGSPGGAVGKEVGAVLRQGAWVGFGSGSGEGRGGAPQLVQSGDGFWNAFWEVTTAETRDRGKVVQQHHVIRPLEGGSGHWCDGRLGCGEKAEAFPSCR
jgi:hypothetical protein